MLCFRARIAFRWRPGKQFFSFIFGMLESLLSQSLFAYLQESGMGSYHGKYSFDCFSHRKSCLARDFSFVTEKLSAIRYPPYNRTELKIKFLSTMLRRLHLFKLSFSFTPSHLVIFLLGLLVMFASTTLLAKYQS